ncbi:MAG: bifunctional hydroxymethylpyrimidine kinase/phosphomethylpyrimidine kinase [Candidatus Marinimicrobia bacterium]|nr:bifunctional hydroxymethylpyrimidine kinase/phosphomethylpyrimidine kinase [Candidatus Neomarinimicrobiota bacterium]
MEYDKDNLLEILNKSKNKKIAVIGDIMLDRYRWGNHARMSPEAPVPVIEIDSTSESLGGAANVFNNLYFLGAKPIVIGVVGNDEAGEIIKKKVQTENLPTDGIFIDSTRVTSVKERVISNGQHVVRLDWEGRSKVSEEIQRKIIDYLNTIIRDLDAVIIQDYNKGVIDAELIDKVIAKCIANETILSVDPKIENFFNYKKTTLFKPNVPETEKALGMNIKTQSDVRKAGRELLDRMECGCVLITQGRDGMTLFHKNGTVEQIQSHVRKVSDVSGAGDTVIASFTLALTAGASYVDAAHIAAISAGIVCEEVGVVPVEIRKIREYLENPSE